MHKPATSHWREIQARVGTWIRADVGVQSHIKGFQHTSTRAKPPNAGLHTLATGAADGSTRGGHVGRMRRIDRLDFSLPMENGLRAESRGRIYNRHGCCEWLPHGDDFPTSHVYSWPSRTLVLFQRDRRHPLPPLSLSFDFVAGPVILFQKIGLFVFSDGFAPAKEFRNRVRTVLILTIFVFFVPVRLSRKCRRGVLCGIN